MHMGCMTTCMKQSSNVHGSPYNMLFVRSKCMGDINCMCLPLQAFINSHICDGIIILELAEVEQANSQLILL